MRSENLYHTSASSRRMVSFLDRRYGATSMWKLQKSNKITSQLQLKILSRSKTRIINLFRRLKKRNSQNPYQKSLSKYQLSPKSPPIVSLLKIINIKRHS